MIVKGSLVILAIVNGLFLIIESGLTLYKLEFSLLLEHRTWAKQVPQLEYVTQTRFYYRGSNSL